MISVNRSFLKDLKLMDKKLDCFFYADIEKFIITYQRAIGEPVPIATLAGMEDGIFRQPDRRDLEFIKSGDMSNMRVHDKLLKVSKHMEDEREKQRKTSYEEWRDRTKDSKVQLIQAFNKVSGGGKGNSAFRRI